MRQSLTVVIAPAVEPVTLSATKSYLRITSSDDDTLITDMIAAAREMVEEYLRRSLITQTLKLTLDWFPERRSRQWWDGERDLAVTELLEGEDYIKLPKGNVQSVTSVVTYDDANNSSTFNVANYRVDTAGNRIILNDSQTWPTDLRERNAVEVTYVAGYGDSASDVPSSIRQAIYMLVNSLYNSRGCDTGIPEAVSKSLRPYRVIHETYNGLR